MRYDFDGIALGNGTAATRWARQIVRAGKTAAVIGPDPQGGLCINEGCMPTKALLEIAKIYAQLKPSRLKERGIILESEARPDFRKIAAIKKGHVDYFRESKLKSVLERGIKLIVGKARFVSDGVMVSQQFYRAKKYLVATGSVPKTLPIPGLDQIEFMTSRDALNLTFPPKSLVIQGGGAIALEFAQYFARMGSKVTVINRSPLLHRFDVEAGSELTSILYRDDVSFKVGHSIEKVESTEEDEILFTIKDLTGKERQLSAAKFLMAVGRKPNLEDLGLEKRGITLVDGRIPINEHLQAKDNHDVYVAGDALGNYQVLHAANQAAEVAAYNALVSGWHSWFGGLWGLAYRRIDFRPYMRIIFTDPPFVQVGLGESEANMLGPNVRITKKYFKDTGRARIMGVKDGFWKILSNPDTGKILGSAILGPRAEELGHNVLALMKFAGTLQDIREMPWYHPTLAEVIKDLT